MRRVVAASLLAAGCCAAPPTVTSELIMAEPVPQAYSHVCSVAERRDAAVVAVWQGGSGEDHTDSAIYTATRAPGGGWSEPKVAVRGHLPNGSTECCMNPNLFKAPSSDDLLLTFHCGDRQNDGKCSTHSWTAYTSRSTDGGATWSARERLPKRCLGSVKNNCHQLSNGEVLCPSSREGDDLLFWTGHFETTDANFSTFKYSNDIFFLHSSATGKFCQGIIQPTFLESKQQPGRIRALFRSGCDVLATAVSDDYGHTWPKYAKTTTVPNPNAGVDMEDSPVGWLLAFNNDTAHRTPLSLAFSTDEGESWEHLADLETDPNGSFAYPYLLRSTHDPSAVHLCYTWRSGGKHNMKYSRLQF